MFFFFKKDIKIYYSYSKLLAQFIYNIIAHILAFYSVNL